MNNFNDFFLCDSCGKQEKGEKHNIYDENWNLVDGCYECDKCYEKKIYLIIKKNYPILTAFIILITSAIIVYFGRIYFPENFHPETVSFFENYYVLTLGLCFVMGMVSLCIFGLCWIYGELVKEIKQIKSIKKIHKLANEIHKNRSPKADCIILSEEHIQQEAQKRKISFDDMVEIIKNNLYEQTKI